MTPDEKIAICKTTRKIASDSLHKTLQKVLSSKQSISELAFANLWLSELRKYKTIFPEGWYTPPPHGIGVLFGTPDKNSRVNYKTLRAEDMWPKETIFLNDTNNTAYLFVSPVDKKTGIIGDFGMTIYVGTDKKIQNHFKTCLQINKEVFGFIQPGMMFSHVYNLAEDVFKKHNVTNEVTSVTDPTGKDIGHTIPSSDNDWSGEELTIIKSPITPWETIKNMISKKRIFINSDERTKCKNGMAFTLEPRLTNRKDQNIPMASFHTIVLIKENGEKELATGFDEIFELVGMDYVR